MQGNYSHLIPNISIRKRASTKMTRYNLSPKWLSFCFLIIQSSAVALVLRKSRIVNYPDSYLASTAVLLSEILKFLVCFVVQLCRDGYNLKQVKYNFFGQESQPLKMLVPAALYFVQNIVQYQAITFLDSATFQVTNQLKVFTTALLSKVILGKKISFQMWLALSIMVSGIVFVQVPLSTIIGSEPATMPLHQNRLLGFAAVFLSCTLSGLAGVW